jgi:enamine deaminase RidA (YjgF/YER057c/UK114 family)
MSEREKKLEEKGYPMDGAPVPGGIYQPVVVEGSVAYLSGSIPAADGKLTSKGSVPSEVSLEEAQKAAELCAANLLRVFARDVGPLSRIKKILKLTGFVNSDPGFTEAHMVINGASRLFIDVLGDAGTHARSALGMASLPRGASVEVEIIVALNGE